MEQNKNSEFTHPGNRGEKKFRPTVDCHGHFGNMNFQLTFQKGKNIFTQDEFCQNFNTVVGMTFAHMKTNMTKFLNKKHCFPLKLTCFTRKPAKGFFGGDLWDFLCVCHSA